MSPSRVSIVSFLFLILQLRLGCSGTSATRPSTNGTDIPYIMAQSACDPARQPQVQSNFHFGYLVSPAPDQVKKRVEFNCTWLVEAPANQTVKSTIMHLELAGSLHVDFHDGHDEHAPLIVSYHGRMNRAYFQTKSNQLFVHYYGPSRLAWASAFHAYLEQSPPAVWCHNDTTIRCRNGLRCVPLAQKCNGIDECLDGTDEEDCPVPNVAFSKPCGLKNEITDNDLRIVGGKASVPTSWPWMVSLRRVVKEPDGHTCGGSIINRLWILTAAHCMAAFPDVTEWTVNAGKYQKLVRDPTEVVRYIKRKVVHEHFIGDEQQQNAASNLTWYDYNANDIALIQLNAPLPDDHPAIGAICLANESFPIEEGLMSYVIGWGVTQMTGNELVLKETIVPVISNAKCRSWMPDYNVGPGMLCAGFLEGGQDACQGDSGGPLFTANANSSHYDQIGIVSTGDRCAAKREAGIYTRVPSFIAWIKNVTSAISVE